MPDDVEGELMTEQDHSTTPLGHVRRAKVCITERHLRSLLDMSPDLRIVETYIRHDPFQLAIVVEGDGLPSIPEYAESPVWSVVATEIDVDGKTYRRTELA